MPIKFRCDMCGARLVAKDERAGKLGRCKACGEETFIPDPSDTGYPLEAFTDEQRALIAKYPNMKDYLLPPGEGFDGVEEEDDSHTPKPKP